MVLIYSVYEYKASDNPWSLYGPIKEVFKLSRESKASLFAKFSTAWINNKVLAFLSEY